jgi:hypothetical protein
MLLRIIRRPALVTGLALALALTAAPAAPVPTGDGEKKSAETPAEKVRKALDQNIANLEIENQQLPLALDQLREETKINFVLDRASIAQMGLDVDNGAPVKAKMQNVKAKTALRNVLNQYALSYAIVGDTVVVTTDDMAVYRQLKQRVSLDLDRVQLDKALKGLARETATNLLLDSRAQKEGQTAVTLQVEDVPLETAVRLIGEAAGLKAVRMGNVVLVTTKTHATELRSEPDLAPSPRVPGLDGPAVPPGIAIPGVAGVVPVPVTPAPPPPAGAKPVPDKTADKPPVETDKPLPR